MLTSDALDGFARALDSRNYSPRSVKIYRQHLADFRRWLGGEAGTAQVTTITEERLQDYQLTLKARKLSPHTQGARIRVVKLWLAWLVEEGQLFQSPADRIVVGRVKARRLPRVLTRSEVERLLSQPDTERPSGIRARAILELLYATGLRKAELLALDLSDLDLEARSVRVREGKGRKHRVLPFGKPAQASLRSYLKEVRPRWVKPRSGQAALFVGRSGNRLGPDRLPQIVRAAATSAGLTHGSAPHGLRHAFATHMIQGGADLITVSRLLGHASPTTTANLYAHLVPSDLKAEHQRTHPAEQDA